MLCNHGDYCMRIFQTVPFRVHHGTISCTHHFVYIMARCWCSIISIIPQALLVYSEKCRYYTQAHELSIQYSNFTAQLLLQKAQGMGCKLHLLCQWRKIVESSHFHARSTFKVTCAVKEARKVLGQVSIYISCSLAWRTSHVGSMNSRISLIRTILALNIGARSILVPRDLKSSLETWKVHLVDLTILTHKPSI